MISRTNSISSFLRGSRDGFGRNEFWHLCDQKTNVVVVVKVKNTDEILGGFNPIGRDSNLNYKNSETNDSFIFSLKNGNIGNSIFSQVKDAGLAIYNCHSYGPCFSNDLYMNGNQNLPKCKWSG